MQEINHKALLLIKSYGKHLTRQQYKTLRGQVLAGDANGAMKGLQKVLHRGDQK